MRSSSITATGYFDPSNNCAAGTRLVKTVGEVAVELTETRLENKQVQDNKDNKGMSE